MSKYRFRALSALLLCTSLSLQAVGCDGNDDPGVAQSAKPIANPGANRDGKIGVEVSLDGSLSKGANPSDTLTYAWELKAPAGSKSVLKTPDAVKAAFTPDVAGPYEVTLIVKSGDVASDPVKITITAKDKENAKPVAVASATPTSPKTGDVINLDGSASTDADGDKLTFKWTLTKMPTGSTAKLSDAAIAKPTITADKAGDYELSLIVNDGKADSDAVSLKVTAADPADAKPTADAKVSKAEINVGESVDLDGSASKAATTTATLSFLWSIKSKPTGSTLAISDADKVKKKLTLTPDIAGDYEFNLVVNDGKKDSDAVTAKVSVKAVKPTAAIAPVTGVTAGHEVELDGSGSKPITTGATLTYTWSTVPTPAPAGVTLTDADKSKAKFKATTAGTYKVQLIVKEGDKESEPKQMDIVVN